MARVKKIIPLAAAQFGGKTSAVASREVEEPRKKAPTLAKRQAAEGVAATTGQLSSGISETASAAEERTRSSNQIATDAEEACGPTQIEIGLKLALGRATVGAEKVDPISALLGINKTSSDALINGVSGQPRRPGPVSSRSSARTAVAAC